MVGSCQVRASDKFGNDQTDFAADVGRRMSLLVPQIHEGWWLMVERLWISVVVELHAVCHDGRGSTDLTLQSGWECGRVKSDKGVHVGLLSVLLLF